MFTIVPQANMFYCIGMLMAMAVVQCSTGFPFLCDAMFVTFLYNCQLMKFLIKLPENLLNR